MYAYPVLPLSSADQFLLFRRKGGRRSTTACRRARGGDVPKWPLAVHVPTRETISTDFQAALHIMKEFGHVYIKRFLPNPSLQGRLIGLTPQR